MVAVNAPGMTINMMAPVTAIHRTTGRIRRRTNSECAVDAADDAADNAADQTANRAGSLCADIGAVRYAVRHTLRLGGQWKRQ